MPKYTAFSDSVRGDSFAISKQYYDLDDVINQGTPPNPVVTRREISLARHHIISWQIIWKTWNRCLTDGLENICTKLTTLLCEGSNPSPAAQDLCWAKRNLIIGPLGNHRLFDPGEDIDFESPVGMGGARKTHVGAMVELGKIMKAYGVDKTMDAKTFEKRFNTAINDCTRMKGDDICIFSRDEWTLSKKPVITWHIAFTGNAEVLSSSDPEWHRGSYSPAAAMKAHEAGITTTERSARIAKMKKRAHSEYIASL